MAEKKLFNKNQTFIIFENPFEVGYLVAGFRSPIKKGSCRCYKKRYI